jgi:hypothetical protein
VLAGRRPSVVGRDELYIVLFDNMHVASVHNILVLLPISDSVLTDNACVALLLTTEMCCEYWQQ